jgi:hypothetical protein
MLERLIYWVTVEPAISLLMAITAVALLGSALGEPRDTSDRLWPWLRRGLEALVVPLLFLGLLWAFRAVLNQNVVTFNATHGSLSTANQESAQSIWGRPHVQREVSVTHYVQTTTQEEVPRADPSQAPLYRNVTARKTVPQNSIIGFVGDVKLTLSERQKGYALYNGYVMDARYEYQVINQSDVETEAEFVFPLSPDQTVHENFQITLDGQDISSQLQFSSQDQVKWVTRMRPGQRNKIVVAYTSRGMDSFYYQVPNQRDIQNFVLTVTIDRLPVSMVNYPAGCLTPTEIHATADHQGSILTWRLDGAITVAGMGVALPQPEQPGANVLAVLYNSPYALTLLGTMLILTLLILGERIRFLDLALLAGAYCMQFLVMAATSDLFSGFWGALFLGVVVMGILTYLLFRTLPSRLHRVLIYALVGFFTVVYPLSGLLTETTQHDIFNELVQAGMIVYLFGLSLYARLEPRGQAAKEKAGAGGA